MPTSKIGDYEFITIGGSLQGTAESLQEITRPGVDGHAYRKAGKRGRVSELNPVVDVASAADAAALVVNVLALVAADPLTIYDDQGQSLSNVKVVSADHLRTQTVATPVGGVNGGDHLVSFRVMVQATQ